ncbi:MAG: T9SS type A sorting domain-containing protein [Flavobacteriales bacterium]
MRNFLSLIFFVFHFVAYSTATISDCDTLVPNVDYQLNENMIILNIEPSVLVDQYKFRYKEFGQAWSASTVVVIGLDDDESQTDNSKIISGLTSCTPYIFQKKIDATDGCQTTWLNTDTVYTTTTNPPTTLSACDSSQISSNGPYYFSSGVYSETVPSGSGCDQEIIVSLTINNSTQETTSVTTCSSFDWNGTIYSQSGQYEQIATNSDGCNLYQTLDLTIEDIDFTFPSLDFNSSLASFTITLEPDSQIDQYKFRYKPINANTWTSVVAIGTLDGNGQEDNFKTISNLNSCTQYLVQTRLYDINGCDSGWNSDLDTVSTTTGSFQNLTVCDSIQLVTDGPFYSQSGSYQTVFNTGICDSIVIYNLTVNQSSTIDTVDVVSCDSYNWNSIDYTSSGLYQNSFTNVQGCDSTVFLNLTINNSSQSTDSVQACDSYTWIDGITYTESNNSATFNLTSFNGCDSTVTLNLELYNATFKDTVIQTCQQEFTFNNITYSESGIYQQTLLNSQSCDSIITLTLLLADNLSSFDTIVTCGSYTWNGQTYDESGDYLFNTTSVFGCDSVSNLSLSIVESYSVTDQQQHCDSFTWVDGITYIESNNSATYLYTSSQGCDSLVTLDLTIFSPTHVTDQFYTCEPFLVSYDLLNGETIQYYAQPENGDIFLTYEIIDDNNCIGNYNYNVIFMNDSVFSSFDTITACDSYEWNGTIYNESGTYQFQTTTNLGCDSIAILDLTINQSSSVSDVIEFCDSYTWINGNGQTYNQDTIVSYVFINEQGCESQMYLDFTLVDSFISELEISQCDPFLWNGQIYNTSGTYQFDTISVNGCDSVAILNLTILEFSSQEDVTVCDSYSWNGSTYNSTGSYTFNTTNVNGCDSIAVLNLTVVALDNLSINGQTNVVENNSYSYSVPQNSGSTYQWSLSSSGTITSGQGTNQISLNWGSTGAKDLCVIETDANGCQGEQSCLDIVVGEATSLEEKENGYLVYPNPTTNNFFINFLTNAEQEREYSLFNLQGKLIEKKVTKSNTSSFQTNLLPSGIYYLKIKTFTETFNEVIIVK